MSGQHEWGELEQSDQLDPRDATLDLSGLIDRMSQQLRVSSGNGRHSASSSPPQDSPEPAPAASPRHGARSEAGLPDDPHGYDPASAGQHAEPYRDWIPAEQEARPELAGSILTAPEPQATADRPAASEPEESRPSPPEPQAAEQPPGPAPTPAVPLVTAAVTEVREVAAVAAVAERPPAGSLADLRQRLERLPYGHPSSPYHVDGERKPPPPRLRHLELAPPTPSRFAASAATGFSSPSLPDRPASASPPVFEVPVSENGAGYDFSADEPGTEVTSAAAVGEPQITDAEESSPFVEGNDDSEVSPSSFGAHRADPALNASPAADDEVADLSAGDSTSQFPAFDGRSVSGTYATDLPVSEPVASQPPPFAEEPAASVVPDSKPASGEPYERRPDHARRDGRTLNSSGLNGHSATGPGDYSQGNDRPPSRGHDGHAAERDSVRFGGSPLESASFSSSPFDGARLDGAQLDGTGRDPTARERTDVRSENGRRANGRGAPAEPLEQQRGNGQFRPSGAGPGGRPVPGLEPATAPAPGPAPGPASGPASGPRGDYDGSWSWGSVALTADQVRMANEAYDRFRTAEGRNLFGSYGNTGLTATMRRVADSTEDARLAPDTEQSALLDPDTFKLRFADMLRRYPDRTADRLARRVPGAISYSFIFAAEHYSAGIRAVQDALSAAGFQLLARRNDWNNTTNRCVATMWHDPANDLPFQVQFHTMASLEAQQLARSSAGARAQSDLASTWASLPAPPGNAEISDYRRETGPARR